MKITQIPKGTSLEEISDLLDELIEEEDLVLIKEAKSRAPRKELTSEERRIKNKNNKTKRRVRPDYTLQ